MIVSQLSEAQRVTFDQFKENVKDCKLPDSSEDYILKWLVARNFDLDQAEKMLRHSVQWRLANRIDELKDQWEPPTVLVKYYPMGIIGYDKLYCPVWIVSFGQADWRGMLQSVSKRDYVRYVCYLSEMGIVQMKKNSEHGGKPVTCQTIVIDMEGLSMRQMGYKPFREVGIEGIKISESNYPENLRKTIIINAPKIFTLVFNMVKPFLHPVTLDKISIFGFDKSEWTAALLKEIDADQLPVHYGGTMTDSNGDPKCSGKISLGGEVPQSYYMETVKPTVKPEMTSMTVSSSSKKKLEYKIIQANSVLRWEFMTEDSDIGFSVYYVERNGDRVDIITNERVQSHLMMEEGDVVCVRPVLYVLEFDNSYSYLRSKKVWYRVVVDLPSASVVPFEEFNQK
ncbi:SEC14-like protein 2 [Daphnia pulicaria]|uniref:SEC14-like protein 2 n=1 Tax=Daphnia pulicaria TaxID=35523 RepID=UPI001EEBC597|nr:SEC14-like protein 2 [Daphnia pulicaria]